MPEPEIYFPRNLPISLSVSLLVFFFFLGGKSSSSNSSSFKGLCISLPYNSLLFPRIAHRPFLISDKTALSETRNCHGSSDSGPDRLGASLYNLQICE